MAVNNGGNPHAESRSCHVPARAPTERIYVSVRAAAVLAVRDSRLRDRKERETLNQKGASLFANWPFATQQRPAINPAKARAREKELIARNASPLLTGEVEGRMPVSAAVRDSRSHLRFRPHTSA